MKKDDHYLLGSLLKTKGIKGEIIIKLNNDCSEEIQKLESIFIDVDNKLVPFFIEEIWSKSLSTAIVKLRGLDEEEKSAEFIDSKFDLIINTLSFQEMSLSTVDMYSSFLSVKFNIFKIRYHISIDLIEYFNNFL